MATRAATIVHIDENTVRFEWSGLTFASTDDGTPIPPRWADFADRHAQVVGTFGAGGNLRVEGSSDAAGNYAALNDNFAVALNITAASVRGVHEVPLLTRPRVTAGDGATNLVVSIVCRRARSAKAI